jgi:CDP-4-dehydro-6-deoxyglucose reductase, E1
MDKESVLYCIEEYLNEKDTSKFIPGETYITSTGKVVDNSDALALANLVLDGAYADTGRESTKDFQRKIKDFYGSQARFVSLCNSGSSANLLALSTITAPEFGSRAAKPGDEIITVAAGFPTTVNPIIQNGLVPVFVDVDLGTYVPNPEIIENAIVEGKTKGIILAHPLGNPFDVDAIKDMCDEYGIWLIEDSCDALGGTYRGQLLGTFGDMATFSFYPAHMITTAEGGAVIMRSPMVNKVLESFRDWGRDCWCDPGKDNTCGKRFGWQCGELPEGFDHKYTYSRIGYNLKMTDMQAAIGASQMDKLPGFVSKRRYNWTRLKRGLAKYRKFFVLPKATEGSNPSWFGFPITVKETASFKREELIQFLESHMVGTRLLFGGNMTKQPAYRDTKYKVFGTLYNTDLVMRSTFWIGVWPGLTDEHIDYMLSVFHKFMEGKI